MAGLRRVTLGSRDLSSSHFHQPFLHVCDLQTECMQINICSTNSVRCDKFNNGQTYAPPVPAVLGSVSHSLVDHPVCFVALAEFGYTQCPDCHSFYAIGTQGHAATPPVPHAA